LAMSALVSRPCPSGRSLPCPRTSRQAAAREPIHDRRVRAAGNR
jgi:hypothetical protein